MVGKINYHFYMTIRSMFDRGEVTCDSVRHTIDDLNKRYPLKFKFRYDWETRHERKNV